MKNKLYMVSDTKQKFKNSLYPKSIFETLSLIYRELRSGAKQTIQKCTLKII